MAQFKIKVADLIVEITARGALTTRICQPYRVDSAFVDITLYAPPAVVRRKQQSFAVPIDEEMAECICLHEALALKLCRFDAFVLHAALIDYRGTGYAIAAPRGVGKTVHAKAWLSHFGEDAAIINGDKPILRRQADGTFRAYGTPWCGKEGQGINTSVPLKGICLLSRGERDVAHPADAATYLDRLVGQVVFPTDAPSMTKGAHLLGDLIRTVPAVVAECTPTEQAAEMVCQALERLH